MSLFDKILVSNNNNNNNINFTFNNNNSLTSSSSTSPTHHISKNFNNSNFIKLSFDGQHSTKRYNYSQSNCSHCKSHCNEIFMGEYGCTIECTLAIALKKPSNTFDMVYMNLQQKYPLCTQKKAPVKLLNENTQNYWNRILNNLYDRSDARYVYLIRQLEDNNCENESGQNISDTYQNKKKNVLSKKKHKTNN